MSDHKAAGEADPPSTKVEKTTPPARTGALGETLVVAGFSAAVYLVGLAYRAGQMLSFGLPVSLAVVRLTDAALAGLIVFTTALLTLLSFDHLESRNAVLAKWVIPGITAAAAFYVVSVGEYNSWMATVVALITLVLSYVVGLDSKHGLPTSERLLLKFPGPASAVFFLGSIIAVAAGLGYSRVGVPGAQYPVALKTSEAAVAVYDDRAVMLGIGEIVDGAAPTSGSFRVISLPSSDMTLTLVGLRQLRRR